MSGRNAPLHVAVAAVLLLVPIQLGWVPPLRFAWGFGLWRYLPPPAAWALAGATLLLCVPACRAAVVRAARALEGAPHFGWVALALWPVLFWALRERAFLGDARILMYGSSEIPFEFPDVGATWLFHVGQRAGRALGGSGLGAVQVLVCASGGLAVFCFARFARLLAPDRAAALVALVLGGGVLRVCFGHVEVYAFVLLAAGAYLWSAVAFLRGHVGLAPPALALGAGLWLHPSFALLLPSLGVAVWLAGRRGERRLAPRLALALALAAAPLFAFGLVAAAAGLRAELEAAGRTALEIAGLRENPQVVRYLVRLPWQPRVPGADFALLSPSHLKYLANSFFVLAPASLPVLAGFGLFGRSFFTRTPEARFLSSAGAGMLLYALLLRPVWGPYDWDLFSLAAVVFASLGALQLGQAFDGDRFAHLAAVLIGASLLFVTVPLVAIGCGSPRAAGPFAEGLEAQPGESGWEALQRRIEPWL